VPVPASHSVIDVAERLDTYAAQLSTPVGKHYFSASGTEGLLFRREHNYCERILDGTKSPEHTFYVPRRYFNIARLHIDYALLASEDETAALEYAARCAAYARMALKLCMYCGDVFPSAQPLARERAGEYLAWMLICGQDGEASDIFSGIDACLAPETDEIYTFVATLFGRANAIDIPADNPFYSGIADAWDDTNLVMTQSRVSLLCDARLELHRLGSYFQNDTSLLFPYEILAWLALRKKAGLENPKEFSHPLMNTPLAKMFLELETLLPEPKELPYAEALIAKLKEQCPKIEGISQPENETSKRPAEFKTAPRTGRYRATLPEGHPQAEALKTDPMAYRTYKEGERFSNAGLEEYEADKIEWVFVE
jgi:hypothetical protein